MTPTKQVFLAVGAAVILHSDWVGAKGTKGLTTAPHILILGIMAEFDRVGLGGPRAIGGEQVFYILLLTFRVENRGRGRNWLFILLPNRVMPILWGYPIQLGQPVLSHLIIWVKGQYIFQTNAPILPRFGYPTQPQPGSFIGLISRHSGHEQRSGSLLISSFSSLNPFFQRRVHRQSQVRDGG